MLLNQVNSCWWLSVLDLIFFFFFFFSLLTVQASNEEVFRLQWILFFFFLPFCFHQILASGSCKLAWFSYEKFSGTCPDTPIWSTDAGIRCYKCTRTWRFPYQWVHVCGRYFIKPNSASHQTKVCLRNFVMLRKKIFFFSVLLNMSIIKGCFGITWKRNILFLYHYVCCIKK